jgi:hypothetical protein
MEAASLTLRHLGTSDFLSDGLLSTRGTGEGMVRAVEAVKGVAGWLSGGEIVSFGSSSTGVPISICVVPFDKDLAMLCLSIQGDDTC